MPWMLPLITAAFMGAWATRQPRAALSAVILAIPIPLAFNPVPGVDLQLLRVLVPAASCGAIFHGRRRIYAACTEPIFLAWLLMLTTLTTTSILGGYWSGDAVRKIIYLWSFTPWILAVHTAFSAGHKTRWDVVIGTMGSIAASLGALQFLAQFVVGADRFFSLFTRATGWLYGDRLGALLTDFPSWFVRVGGQDWLRLFFPFPDPHIAAFVLSLVGTFSLWRAGEKKGRGWWIAAGVAYTAVLLTFSRGGYIGGLVGAGVVLATQQRVARKPLMAAAAAATLLILLVGAPVRERFAAISDLTEGSNRGRVALWGEALRIVEEHPLGVGVAGYADIAGKSGGKQTPVTAHSLYADMLVALGVVGMGVVCAFFAVVGGSLHTTVRTHKGLLAGLAGLAAHAMFENPLFAPSVLALALFMASAPQPPTDET